MEEHLAHDALSLTVGSKPVGLVNLSFSLTEGSLYFFRLAACHSTSGCGPWSTVVSARAERLQMEAVVQPLETLVSSHSGLLVNFTTIKPMPTEDWFIQLNLPSPYLIHESVSLIDAGVLCVCEVHCDSCATTVVKAGTQVRVSVHNRTLPEDTNIWFSLDGITAPGVTGATPSCSIVTYSSEGAAIDENLEIPGIALSPRELVVAMDLVPAEAGSESELFIIITAEVTVPPNASITIIFPTGSAGYNLADVELGIGADELQIIAVGSDFVSIQTSAESSTFSFSLAKIVNPLFVDAGASTVFSVATHLGRYVPNVRSAEALLGQLSNWYQDAAPFSTTVGALRGMTLLDGNSSWPAGGVVDVSFTYEVEDVIREGTHDSKVVLVFPTGVSGVGTVEFWRTDSDGPVDLSFDLNVLEDGRHQVDVKFDNTLGVPGVVMVFRNVQLPVYSTQKAAEMHVESQIVSDGGSIAQNQTALSFSYGPGVILNASVELEMEVAGEETSVRLSFESVNPTPQDGFIMLTLPEHFKLPCDVSQENCDTSVSLFYNGARLGSDEVALSLDTRDRSVVIALSVTDEMGVGTQFELSFSSIVNQPWEGEVEFGITVLTAAGDVVETGASTTTVREAPLLTADVELAELAVDRDGVWEPLRPVSPDNTEVHLGVLLTAPVALPRASRIIVEVLDAQVLELREDAAHPHVVPGGGFTATLVEGGIELVQVDAGCSQLRCVPAGELMRFNFVAKVSVATGSALGKARRYRLKVLQSMVGETLVASAALEADDALVPGGPLAVGGSRRLMSEEGAWLLERTSVTLSAPSAGDIGEVVLGMRLMVSLPPDAAIVINLPPDANAGEELEVTTDGLKGIYSVDVTGLKRNSSIVLSRDPENSDAMLYGTTEVSCFTEGGTVPHHTPCHLPFVYQGVTYFDCTPVDNNGVDWCATTTLWVGYWGNCFCNSTENFLDVTIRLSGIKNQPFAGEANFGLSVLSRSSETDILIAQDSIIAATIAARTFDDFYVQLDPPYAGSEGHARVEVTLTNPLPVDGSLQLELPTMFGYSIAPVSSLSGVLTPWELSVSSSGDTMLLTLSVINATGEVPASTVVALDIDGVTIRRWAGDVMVTVRTLMGPRNVFAVSEEGIMDLTVYPNSLSDVSVELSSQVAGSTGSVTVRFRPFNPVPAEGGIYLTLPEGFSINPPQDVSRTGAIAPLSSWRLCGVLGSADVLVSNVQIDTAARSVLLFLSADQSLAAGNIVEFSIPGVTNVQRAGPTAPFALRTVLADLSVIDHSLRGTSQTLLPDMLGAASVSVLSSEAGTFSTAKVSFSTSNVLPGDGFIFVSFPPAFSLISPVSDGYVVGIPGMLAVVEANVTREDGYCTPGCNVTLSLRGMATARGTRVSFGITNVENMHSSGQTGSFLIQTQTKDREVIDEALVDGSKTSAAKLGFASIKLVGEVRAGGAMALEVAFTTSNPLGEGGRIVLAFPPRFNLSDTCYTAAPCGSIVASGASLDGGVAVVDSTLEFTTSGALAGDSDVSFTVMGVKAPQISGRTGAFQLKTMSAAGVDIDAALHVESLTTLPGDLDVSCSLSTSVAGSETMLHVQGTVVEGLPSGAWLEVEFPLGVITPETRTTEEVAGIAVSIVGRVAIVRPSPGSLPLTAGSSISLGFSRLRNPTVAGDYEFRVRTMVQVASQATTGISTSKLQVKAVVDEAVSTLRVSPAGLQGMEVLSVETAGGNVGFRGAMRVRFRISNPIPSDGAVHITLPENVFDIGSVVSATFKAARSPSAHVVYPDGSTCVDIEDNNVTLTRTSGVEVSAGTLIEIEVSTVHVVGFVGSAGAVVVRTTTRDGVSIDVDETPFVVSLTGILTHISIVADVTLAGSRVPALGLSFWTGNTIPAGGVLVLELPAGAKVDLDILACSIGIGGAPLASTDSTHDETGGRVRLTVAAPERIKGGAVVSLECDGTFLRGSSGPTVYRLLTLSQDGQVIDAGDAVLAVVAGSLEARDFVFETPIIRTPNALNFTLVGDNAVPAGSRFEIVAPSDFMIDSGALMVTSVIGSVSRILPPSVVGQQILVRLQDNIAANEQFSVLVSGISNRGYTGFVEFELRTLHRVAEVWEADSSELQGQVIDETTVGMNVVALAVDKTTVTTEAGVVGAFGEVCFSSELAADLPGYGAIVLTFPNSYDTTLIPAVNREIPGLDGYVSVSKDGLAVEYVRMEGTTFGPGTEIEICVQNVGMPAYEIEVDAYTFETRTGSAADLSTVIIERTLIPSVPPMQAALSLVGAPYLGSDRRALPAGPGQVRVVPETNRAGATPQLEVSFWTVNAVPQDGAILLRLPSGFTVDSPEAVQCSADAPVPDFQTQVNGAEENWDIRIVLSENMKASVSVHITCSGIRVARRVGSYTYLVQTQVAAGNVIDSGLASGTVVSNSVQPASLTLSSPIAHALSSIEVSITPANPLSVGDTIEIDFPAGFHFCEELLDELPALDCLTADTSMLATCEEVYSGCMCNFTACECKKSYAACKALEGGGADSTCINVVGVTQGARTDMCVSKLVRGYGLSLPTHPQPATTMTVAVDSPLAGGASLTVMISGGRNRGWTGPTGSFSIRTRNVDGTLVDGCDPLDLQASPDCSTEEVASLELAAAEPATAAIELELYTAGNEGRAILSFTTNTTFLNDSKIDLTLPDGFLFDPYAPLSGLHQGLDGALLASVSGNRIEITRVAGTAVPPSVVVRVEFTMVANPKNSSCTGELLCADSSGEFTLRIATRDNTTQDLITSTVDPLLPAPLNYSRVTPEYPVAGASGALTVEFRTVNPLPADGRMTLALPPDFSLAPMLQAETLEGFEGVLIASQIGPRLVLVERLRGTPIFSGAHVAFRLSSVRNRASSGPSGTFQLRTRTAEDTLIDVDLGVAGHHLLPGELQHASATPASLVAGATSPLSITLVVANPLPANGGFNVLLPSGFEVPQRKSLIDGVTDGVSNVASADLFVPTAVALAGMDGQLVVDVLGPREVQIRRVGASGVVAPCAYSRPEIELRRDVISPGFVLAEDAETFFAGCLVRLELQSVRNKHVSGGGNVYRLRTLDAYNTTIDEALLDAHPVTHGALLRTDVEPASLESAAVTSALVTMVASNGIPADGRVRVTFPPGFDIKTVNVGAAATDTFTADGSALQATTAPNFTLAEAASTSAVPLDLARITLTFVLNMELTLPSDAGTTIVVGNLGSSSSASGSLALGGPDAALFSGAVLAQPAGTVTLAVAASISARTLVNVEFDLLNPPSDTPGSTPTIELHTPPCGYTCTAAPVLTYSMAGIVLETSAVPAIAVKEVGSLNAVVGELTTTTVTLSINVALQAGGSVTISGLLGSQTASTDSLPVTGPASDIFNGRAQFNSASGDMALSVWETVLPDTEMRFSFVLRNNAALQPAQSASVSISTSDQDTIRISSTMVASDLLLSRDGLSFAVAELVSNSAAAGAHSTLAIRLRPTAMLGAGVIVTLTGLVGSQTIDGSIPVSGPDSHVFEDTALWLRSGILQLTISSNGPGLRDDRVSEAWVILQNPAATFAGSEAAISTSSGIPSTPVFGSAFEVSTEPAFEAVAIGYSSVEALRPNVLTISMTANANLGPGATVTISHLPMDVSVTADCADRTVLGTPCVFPFTYAGMTFNSCAGASVALRMSGSTSALAQGLPWCATSPHFSTEIADVNGNVDTLWGFCECSPQMRDVAGQDAELFGEVGAYDQVRSTLVLKVAENKLLRAQQTTVIQFVIRNPAVMDQGGLPDYMLARVKAKAVDPYANTICNSSVLAATATLSFQERIAAGLGGAVRAEDVLVINTTMLGAGELVHVEYCMIDAATAGLSNSYGYVPQVSAQDRDFAIPLTRVDAADLIIRPQCTDPLAAAVAGDTIAFDVMSVNSRVDPGPAWTVAAVTFGSSDRGVLTSITLSIQANWELESPTVIRACCFHGYTSPFDTARISVFNQGGSIFGNAGTYDLVSGAVSMTIAEGHILPCSRATNVSFTLRNPNSTVIGQPVNLTSFAGPLRDFSVRTSGPVHVVTGEPDIDSGFWVTKKITDTSRAMNGLNLLTIRLRPTFELFVGSNITIGGLVGSSTPSRQDFALETGGEIFHAEWINERDACSEPSGLDCIDEDARVVLSVRDDAPFLPSDRETAVAFLLKNKAYHQSAVQPTIALAVANNTFPGGVRTIGPETLDGVGVQEASEVPGFSILQVSSSTAVFGALSTITLKMVPNTRIEVGSVLNITGLGDTCPERAAHATAPPLCANVQNPSSAALPLSGAGAALFASKARWNAERGTLSLRTTEDVQAGATMDVEFQLRNKGEPFGGGTVVVRVDGLTSQLEDGVRLHVEPGGSSLLLERDGSGRALVPGETLSFSVQGVRLPPHSGPTGSYQIATLTADGLLIDEDLAVGADLVLPSSLEARVDLSHQVAGYRGDVTVSLSTTNPVPPGGTITVWFPKGFQLDTGNWDVFLWNEPLTVGGAAGLTVSSSFADLSVRIATEGSVLHDTGLGIDLLWHTAAIVTNRGTSALPAVARWNFTLHGVQYPIASHLSGTYQVRTFAPGGESIDQDLEVPGPRDFGAGTLGHADVQPSSLMAGAISPLTISFVNMNPIPADARFEVRLPEGFTLSSDQGAVPIADVNTARAGSAAFGIDFAAPVEGGVFVPVGSTRARQLVAEPLDGLDGNLTLEVHDARRFTVWRRGANTVQRQTRVRFRLVDPSAEFEVSAPTVGVQNPERAGATGSYSLQVKLHDGTVVDEDLAVPGDVIAPGALQQVDVHPVSLHAGDIGALHVSLAVANPLPVDGSVRVELPVDLEVLDSAGTEVVAQPVLGLDGALTAEIVDRQTLVITRSSAVMRVQSCQRPMCGATNVVTGGSVSASAGWRPPSHPANAFAEGLQWRSGPITQGVPQWVQYDFGRPISVCSYSFQSRASDVLGYLSSDGPTSYRLSGSLDGNAWTVVHAVEDGSTWTSTGEARAHELHVNAHFRFFRLEVLAVPGRSSGNQYAVLRNVRLFSPTGEDPHTAAKETQCKVAFVVPVQVRNRHYAGATGTYTVSTADASGLLIDEARAAPASILLEGRLQAATVTPASLLAGVLTTMRVRLTTSGPLPEFGEIEVTFPTEEAMNLSLASLPRSTSRGIDPSGLTLPVLDVEGNLDGGLDVHLIGNKVRIVRDGSGSALPPGTEVTFDLQNIRNQRLAGPGGTYQVRTLIYDSNGIDADYAVAPTVFTSPRLQNASLLLSSNVAGAAGPLVLTFWAQNPIPRDGRITLRLPQGYHPVKPLYAQWIYGADGYLVTTVDEDGSIVMSRDGEVDAPGLTEMQIKLETVWSASREGDSGTFEVCTLLDDGRVIDCTAPNCADCAGEAVHIEPKILVPGLLRDTAVRPGALYTGYDGLEVAFETSNALMSGSVIEVVVPASFRPGEVLVESLAVDERSCEGRVHPDNETTSFPILGDWSAPDLDLDVVLLSTSKNHTVAVTLTGADIVLRRGTRVHLTLGNVRAPGFKGPTGLLQLRTKNPEGVVVDEDNAVPSVEIAQGSLLDAAVQVSSLVAGDAVSLTVTLTSADDVIVRDGAVAVTLPPAFSAANVAPYYLLDDVLHAAGSGFEALRVTGGIPSGVAESSGLQQGNYTVAMVLNQSRSGEMRFELRGLRLQNFSGPTGPFQIRTWTPDGALIDQDLTVPGQVLRAAALRAAEMRSHDATAGTRTRLLVEFVPHNPLPLDCQVALALPPGFSVSANSSVAVALGNSATNISYSRVEYDRDGALDGDLELTVHSERLVTVRRIGAAVAGREGVRVALFVDRVRNPQRSGATGTFQVRTLRADGTAIDEDLSVPGFMVHPGNFSGICPPACLPPAVRPESLEAGRLTNVSIAFVASNPIPSDALIEVLLPWRATVAAASGVSPGSALDVLTPSAGRPGPVLDGALEFFVSQQAVRIRRDGSGRRIEAGEFVSFTVHGVKNQGVEGDSGEARLTVEQADRVVIDRAIIPGLQIVPVQFSAVQIVKVPATVGKRSTMQLLITAGGDIVPGSWIAVDFSGEDALPGVLYTLDVDGPVQEGAWSIDLVDGAVLYLKLLGEAIPAETPFLITVAGVMNPLKVMTTEYVVSLLQPGGSPLESGRSARSVTMVEYSVGELANVIMLPQSSTASVQGAVKVEFIVSSPLPPGAVIDVHLPQYFKYSEGVTAVPLRGLTGSLVATRMSDTLLRLRRTQTGSLTPRFTVVHVQLRDVRNQEFSGSTGQLRVSTFLASLEPMDTGLAPPIYIETSAIDGNVAVTMASTDAGAVTSAQVSLLTSAPIPPNGKLLIQFPAGFQIPSPPEYVSFADGPARVDASLPGTILPDTPPAAPYYDIGNPILGRLAPPASFDASLFRGAAVLVTRLGGSTVPVGASLSITLPGVRARTWAGFSGTFQMATLLGDDTLVEMDIGVAGYEVRPGQLTEVEVSVSSLVSGVPVDVVMNATLANAMPPVGELHVTFPSGYRDLEYVDVSAHAGLHADMTVIGLGYEVGGATVLKVRYTGLQSTAAGSRISVLFSGVSNRFFSSRAALFAIETLLPDGITVVDQRLNLAVPAASGGRGPAYGVVVEGEHVRVFDASDPRQVVSVVDLGSADLGAVTHGVSALDSRGDRIFFVAGGVLAAVGLSSPELVHIPLRAGGSVMGGVVSMEWDVQRERLVGLAVLDGEMSVVAVDPLLGNLTRLEGLPACGACECSPAQGVSALDPDAGILYIASQVMLLGLSAADGASVSHVTVVHGDRPFNGFASLEFHAPRQLDGTRGSSGLGLLGVALFGEVVELVRVDPLAGTLEPLARIFDADFVGTVFGGISSLSPDSGHYVLLAHARLLAVDLERRAVAHYSPYETDAGGAANAGGQWGFLEMSAFLPPLEVQANGSRVVNVSGALPPLDVADLDISVLGLAPSLPVRPGGSGSFVAVDVVGADVRQGDELKVSPAPGGCTQTLPGGGAQRVTADGGARVSFELDFEAPGAAHLCYRRAADSSGAWREVRWGAERDQLTFPLTMAAFQVPIPVPVGAPVQMRLSGRIRTGDRFLAVLDDMSVNPADLCGAAAASAIGGAGGKTLLYPGSRVMSIVSVDAMQLDSHAYGAWSVLTSDLLLDPAGGAPLRMCYSAAGGDFTLMAVEGLGADGTVLTQGTHVPVAGAQDSSTQEECSAAGQAA